MKGQKINRIFKISLIAVLMLALLWNPLTAKAGFGDFNDYDYGGGSDWSYDSGSDWSYDYDSGSDWDYDYDSGSYGSSSGSLSANDIHMIVWLIQGILEGNPAAWICIILIVFLLFGKKLRIRRKRSYTKPASPAPTYNPPTYNPPTPKKVYTLPDRTDEISRIIQERDAAFTAPDFLSFVRDVYVDIQDAWMKRDLEPVRGVLHQNLYQQTRKQIDKKIADGIVNYLERISVNTAYLTSYRRDAEYEYVTVYLAASMIDYQVKEATGEILFGDKTTRWNLKYKMTFVRANDAVTRSAEEKDEGFVCPNCGAPLKGTSFGVCEYCDSVVTTGVYDWVLSSFGVVKEDTVDEGIVY